MVITTSRSIVKTTTKTYYYYINRDKQNKTTRESEYQLERECVKYISTITWYLPLQNIP